MTETPPRLTLETLGSRVNDPRDWRRFSPDQGTVVGMYAGDEDLSNVVVWCLEPGQGNSTHRHPDSAHFIVALEGSGECLRGDEGPPDPVRTGPGAHHSQGRHSRHPQHWHGAVIVRRRQHRWLPA